MQAAINAARGYLPANLPSNPTYRKVNPADSPIFMLALTSKVLTKGQMYDAASTVMAQKLSQITGVGQVMVGGSALPAVRVELNPTALNKYGIGIRTGAQRSQRAPTPIRPKATFPMAATCGRSAPTIRSSRPSTMSR